MGNLERSLLTFLAGTTVEEGYYQFNLNIKSDNFPELNFPIYVTVSDSAVGRLWF